MAPRLDLRQSQSLVMTPQLQQAIKLLQLSSQDLGAYVEDELDKNPLLDRADPDTTISTDAPAQDPLPETGTLILDPAPDGLTEAPLDHDFNTPTDEDGPDADPWDAPDSNGFQIATTVPWDQGGGTGDYDGTSLEHRVAETTTLLDHMDRQILLDLSDPTERLIARYLLIHLDAAGYFTGTLEEVAQALDTHEAVVACVLAKLQAMDPPGVFARSLRECLALQLRDKNRLDPAMEALLDNLELLARRDLNTLCERCGVDADDMTEMVSEIRALDPKPALKFDPLTVQVQIPDVLILPGPHGSWRVDLNPDALPRVLVNNRYAARLAGTADKATKTFLSENLASANWLVRALDQRARTILKVAVEIVRRQEAFFTHGIRFLKPMTLRDVAEAVELHESTVSRATSNKTMASPRGVFEMKYFFTQSIGGSNGTEHSAETVRHRIKTLIDAENPQAPLSDETLVEALKKDGMDIARRTVAKYRESMNIPSSVQRRRRDRDPLRTP